MFQKDAAGEYLEQRLPNGQSRHYRRRRVLGKGGFAKCYEVSEEKTGQRYACKAIDKESISHSKLKEKLQSEIEIHRRLIHKNIVRFESVFEDEKFIYILLQLCSNNTLNELLKRRKVLSELETRYYLLQLLGALHYLHKLKIVHRDLKLDNFFLGDNLEVKVGDFGLAAVVNQPRRTICGTPNYIAPEILDSRSGYSYEVDVWSMGIATYLMLYGRYPFEANDPKFAATKINSKTYLINPLVSECAKSFINRMLQIRPCDRLSVKQLLDHEFLTHFDIPATLPRSSLACPLNSNFLQQFKPKKILKLDLPKEDEEFNFMLESRESPSSPRVKHSNISQSMSASKILELSKVQQLPYVFSQKKVCSFHIQNKQSGREEYMEGWISRWWQFPKYGLFYITTDNTLGVRFNDGSSLKSHPFPSKFSYCTSVKNKKQLITASSISKLSDRQMLSKLKSFKQMKEIAGITHDQNQHQGLLVRKYARSEDMFVLWLSNGNLQCRFSDRSELIVSLQRSLFISSQKIRVFFQSDQISKQNAEIVEKQKRLSELLKRISSIHRTIPV